MIADVSLILLELQDISNLKLSIKWEERRKTNFVRFYFVHD